MQLGKKWLLLIFFAVPLMFVPPHNSSSQRSDLIIRSNTDSLEKAVFQFVEAVNRVEAKTFIIEAKIIENERKEKEISRLVNKLIYKANSNPKTIVKKVVEEIPVYIPVQDRKPSTNVNPEIPYQTQPDKKQPISGLKKIFNRIFKKKDNVE